MSNQTKNFFPHVVPCILLLAILFSHPAHAFISGTPPKFTWATSVTAQQKDNTAHSEAKTTLVASLTRLKLSSSATNEVRLFASGTVTYASDVSVQHGFMTELDMSTGAVNPKSSASLPKVFTVDKQQSKTDKPQVVLMDSGHGKENFLAVCGYLTAGTVADFGDGYTVNNANGKGNLGFVAGLTYSVESSSLKTTWAKPMNTGNGADVNAAYSKCYDVDTDGDDVVTAGQYCASADDLKTCNGLVQKNSRTTGEQTKAKVFDSAWRWNAMAIPDGSGKIIAAGEQKGKGAIVANINLNDLSLKTKADLGSSGDYAWSVDAHWDSTKSNVQLVIAGTINNDISEFRTGVAGAGKDGFVLSKGGYVAKMSVEGSENDDIQIQWIGEGGQGTKEVIMEEDRSHVILLGYYDTVGTFKSGKTEFQLNSLGGKPDMYVARYDAATGTGDYLLDAGGYGMTYPWAMAIDPNNNDLFIGGLYQGHLSFGDVGPTPTFDMLGFATKLQNSVRKCADCLKCSDGKGFSVNDGWCYVNNRCIGQGKASPYVYQSCYFCDHSKSPTELQPTANQDYCLIGDKCYKDGQTKNPKPYHTPDKPVEDPESCIVCNTAEHNGDFSIMTGYSVKQNQCVKDESNNTNTGNTTPPNDGDKGMETWLAVLLMVLLVIVAVLAVVSIFLYGIRKPDSCIGRLLYRCKSKKSIKEEGVIKNEEDCYQFSNVQVV
eukprot:Nk52_evm13s348 gene=Nk52_evmTU13s348